MNVSVAKIEGSFVKFASRELTFVKFPLSRFPQWTFFCPCSAQRHPAGVRYASGRQEDGFIHRVPMRRYAVFVHLQLMQVPKLFLIFFRCSSIIWDTVVGAQRRFFTPIFFYFTQKQIFRQRKIIWGDMQASRCGTANHTINPIKWTVPFEVHMYVQIFRSIFSLSSLVQSPTVCCIQTLARYVSTAWYLMQNMIERCSQCSLKLYFSRPCELKPVGGECTLVVMSAASHSWSQR